MKKYILYFLIPLQCCFSTPLLSQEFGSWDVPIPDLANWWRPVKDFSPVMPAEHPRLLFRKQDLPTLRHKMNTPEGKAILSHLRSLLNGGNGAGMPIVFNHAKKAYAAGGKKHTVLDTAGVYTFGHVAAYGLLYQLTRESKYAEWGRKCFELALEGQRDRDDRYSWIAPGGALRAGPVLGWMAVGYDLCYDGWDPATRKKIGKAIEYYSTDMVQKWGQVRVDLASMVSGTMPPKSNHYGMQVGGAALALLAITKEPWVDQTRLDSLLTISTRSMVHNVTQGFGDGGYFAEGDGTGSMAAQIAYLPAIQAWKNTLGMDFAAVENPNVRMTALKWLYLTAVQEGKAEIWPIRGGYPHNVWSRRGLSGGGYFSIPFGILAPKYAAAMKWFYEQFLLAYDTKAGRPYEVSDYPHIVVCAFVNWPTHLVSRNPETVLPLSYRDSQHGFYAWRNRWQDADDIIITALTQDVKGFMKANADTTFHIIAYGQKITWGNIPGRVKQWQSSEDGSSSVLQFESGLSVGVDLSGKSGADVLLIATGDFGGQQFKLEDQIVSVKVISQQKSPSIRARGNRLHIGKQQIKLLDGRWRFH